MNNSERCRFEGIVQSFDIINAELYKEARILKATLDKNPEFTLTEEPAKVVEQSSKEKALKLENVDEEEEWKL